MEDNKVEVQSDDAGLEALMHTYVAYSKTYRALKDGFWTVPEAQWHAESTPLGGWERGARMAIEDYLEELEDADGL